MRRTVATRQAEERTLMASSFRNKEQLQFATEEKAEVARAVTEEVGTIG